MSLLVLCLLWDTACGRLEECPEIYQWHTPLGWVREETKQQELHDTTKPIASYKKEGLTLTVHNFPLSQGQNSIPPKAQIERWMGQFEDWEGSSTPSSHGGFVGWIAEGGNEELQLIGAAFSLSPTCKHQIRWREYFEPEIYANELVADFTVKVVGPKELIEKERETILSLIHSFELIDEI